MIRNPSMDAANAGESAGASEEWHAQAQTWRDAVADSLQLVDGHEAG